VTVIAAVVPIGALVTILAASAGNPRAVRISRIADTLSATLRPECRRKPSLFAARSALTHHSTPQFLAAAPSLAAFSIGVT